MERSRPVQRLRSRAVSDLAIAYTPGVAALAASLQRIKKPYILTPSRQIPLPLSLTAVLCFGLGNIGPEAAMPVMEGKCVLFKEFGDINAFPICLSTQDPDEIVAAVKAIAPTFGGINLGGHFRSQMFEIEERLKKIKHSGLP